MKQPDMALTVGKGAPLSLLIKAGCLQTHPFSVTREHRDDLLAQLFPSPPLLPNRSRNVLLPL
jgi:hypothetical protein